MFRIVVALKGVNSQIIHVEVSGNRKEVRLPQSEGVAFLSSKADKVILRISDKSYTITLKEQCEVTGNIPEMNLNYLIIVIQEDEQPTQLNVRQQSPIKCHTARKASTPSGRKSVAKVDISLDGLAKQYQQIQAKYDNQMQIIFGQLQELQSKYSILYQEKIKLLSEITNLQEIISQKDIQIARITMTSSYQEGIKDISQATDCLLKQYKSIVREPPDSEILDNLIQQLMTSRHRYIPVPNDKLDMKVSELRDKRIVRLKAGFYRFKGQDLQIQFNENNQPFVTNHLCLLQEFLNKKN